METPDPMLTCPYNQSHQILKSRMQYHLIKCRKNHPNTETEICPLDVTHHIPKPEFQFHLTVCSNRKVVDTAKYVTTDSLEKAAIPPYQMPVLPPSSENWDDDLVTSTYQPSEKAAGAPVLRQLTGATKSERKNFRLQERRRVQELQEKGHFDPQENNLPKVKPPLQLPSNFGSSSTSSVVGVGRASCGLSEGEAADPIAEFTKLSLSRGRGGRPPNKV